MSVKYHGTEKVGETFEYNGKTYKVMACRKRVKNMCTGCVFYEEAAVGCHEMACNPFLRDDETRVVYKEVKQVVVINI